MSPDASALAHAAFSAALQGHTRDRDRCLSALDPDSLALLVAAARSLAHEAHKRQPAMPMPAGVEGRHIGQRMEVAR